MALAPSALEFTRGSPHRASFPLVEEDRGGGSRRPTRRASDGAFDNLHGPRDSPPLPAPTRGGGCANAIDSTKMQQALVRRPRRKPWSRWKPSAARLGSQPSPKGAQGKGPHHRWCGPFSCSDDVSRAIDRIPDAQSRGLDTQTSALFAARCASGASLLGRAPRKADLKKP